MKSRLHQGGYILWSNVSQFHQFKIHQPACMVVGEFYQLKSTYLKFDKAEKHCSRKYYSRGKWLNWTNIFNTGASEVNNGSVSMNSHEFILEIIYPFKKEYTFFSIVLSAFWYDLVCFKYIWYLCLKFCTNMALY